MGPHVTSWPRHKLRRRYWGVGVFLGRLPASRFHPANIDFRSELQKAGCSSGTCEVFVGLERDEGSFSFWRDGTPFGGTAYSNWNQGDPNNVDDSEDCTEMVHDSGKWNDISCSVSRLAMCEKPQPTICGAGWSQFGDCCYTLLSTWQDIVVQRGYCQDSGAELVSISSLVENTFVQGKLFQSVHQVRLTTTYFLAVSLSLLKCLGLYRPNELMNGHKTQSYDRNLR